MKKAMNMLLIMTVVLMALVGCTPEKPPVVAVRDSIVFTSWLKATTYDPTAGGVVDKSVNHAIFDTLVRFGPEGEIEPMLAESWEESADGMEVTFTLRKDVKYHNGASFDADDVIYFFEKALEGSYAVRVNPYLSGVEKIDQYTIKARKSTIYSNILAAFAELYYMMPREAHAADPEAFNEHPIGCGPYKFIEKKADGAVVLEAFDEYYGAKPGFKNVTVQQPLDASAAVIALETGSTDFIVMVPNSQHAIIEGSDKMKLTTAPSWFGMTVLQMGKALGGDIDLRKAIYYGISRDNAVAFATEGTGRPATELFAEKMMGKYKGKVAIESYNEAKAKEHLEKSNYEGEEISITITGDGSLAQAIQADLKKIGINIRIDQVDVAALLQRFETGEIDLYLTDLGNSMMAPQNLLVTFKEDGRQIGENMFSTPEYNTLVSSIQALTDNATLDALTLEAFEMLRDSFVIVNLYESSVNYAHASDLVYDYPMSASTYVYYLADIKPVR